jgi:hypothetical protein
MRGILMVLLLVLTGPAMAQAPNHDLVGKSATELKAQLGEPSRIWPEHPAYTWHYANDICVLQLYLYAPGVGGEAVVRYAEARLRGADQQPMSADQVQACLRAREGSLIARP